MRRGALLVCLLLLGCERKAPGPAECVALANLVVDRFTPQAVYDELVRTCLTTPYDRAMLACVERSGALRSCRHQFELRQRGYR